MRKLTMMALAAGLALLGTSTALAADFSPWARSASIQFSGYTQAGTLTNFPALVVLSTNITGFNYADLRAGAHDDLRFADSTGTNELYYEVDSWDTNGSSYVWVRVPALTDSNTLIRAYWGLLDQTAPAYTTNGMAWDSGFAAVWHLQESGSSRADATGKGNTGTTQGNAAYTGSGAVGGAAQFDGTGDYISVGDLSAINGAGKLTVSAWAYLTTLGGTADSDDGAVLGRGTNSAASVVLWYNVNGSGTDGLHAYSFHAGSASIQSNRVNGSSGKAAAGRWQHVAGVMNGATRKLYINGLLDTTTNAAPATTVPAGTDARLGGWSSSTNYDFAGRLDEVRVSTNERSPAWLWSEWMTVASNAVFASYGTVSAQGAWPMNLDATDVTAGSATLNGALLSTSQPPATVGVAWGSADGGTNFAAWATNATFAGFPNPGPLSTNLVLNPDTLYYSRYYSTNTYGTFWSSPSAALITGELGIQATDPAASESGPDTGTFSVYRPAWATGITLRVAYTISGTASNGVDYVALPNSIDIPVGATNALITVTPLADTEYVESNETVTLTLVPGPYRIGPDNTATVTIANSQPSTVAVVSGAGDNTTGDGTLAHPYRSLTRALTNGYTTVYVGAGTYTTNSGESFPLTVPAGTDVIGLGAPADSVIDAGSTNRGLTLLGAGTTNLIANLSLVHTRGTAIVATGWQGTFSNLVITDVANGGAMQSCSVIYYSNSVSRSITFSGVTISNVSCSVDRFWWFRGDGSVLFTNCTLRSLTTTVTQLTDRAAFLFSASDGLVSDTGGFDAQFADCIIDGLTIAAGGDSERGGFMTGNGNTLAFDRCQVRGVTSPGSGVALVAPDRGIGYVRNCLFYNINCGTTYSAIGGYSSTAYARNCTFDTVNAVFRVPDGSFYMYAYNTVLNNCGVLNRRNPDYLRLYNVNLYSTPTDIGYDTVNSTNITFMNPWFVDAANSNFHLRTLSPLVDAGNNSYVQASMSSDLDRTTRIQDGDADGTATVDLGAYEVNFSNPGSPRFQTPWPVYHANAGQVLQVPVWIQPPVTGAVTASVTYGTNVSGAATLAFPTGSATGTLSITVQSALTVSNGTLVAVSLSESGTTQGVANGDIGLHLYSTVVTVPGYMARTFVRAGITNQYRVQMPDDTLTAASNLTVTVGSIGGTGSNAIQWIGSNIITAGDWQTAGYLQVVGGTGENTGTLSIDGGMSFSENGATTLPFSFVGYASPLYLAPTGSDTAGVGSLAAPLRSLTFALPLLVTGEEARLAAGLYSTNSGESFPITVPEGITVRGVMGASADTNDSTVIDANGTDFNFLLGTLLVSDPGIQGSGGLYNLALTGAKGTAIRARYWGGTLSNCVIRTVVNGGSQDSTAGLRVENATSGRAVALRDLTITNIASSASKIIFMDGGTTATLSRCHFQNLSLSAAASYGVFDFEDYLVTMTDCSFVNIAWPTPSSTTEGGLLLVNKATTRGTLTMDRCVFHDLTSSNGSVIVLSRFTTSATIRNSLFYNIVTGIRPVIGHSYASPNVRNCTIDNASTAFRGYNSDTNYWLSVYNSSVSYCTNLCSANTDRLRLTSVNVYATAGGSGYDTNNSANVTAFDPAYRNGTGGDYRLRASSQLIDAGITNYVQGTLDLALTNRIMGASVDLGAYETIPPFLGTVYTVR